MRLTVNGAKALAASGLFALTLSVPAAAFAQTQIVGGAPTGGVATASGPSTTIPPEVENTTIVPPTTAPTPTTAPEVLDTTVEADRLAFTGTDVVGATILGAGAIAVGAALLAGRRRRAAHES